MSGTYHKGGEGAEIGTGDGGGGGRGYSEPRDAGMRRKDAFATVLY